MINFEFYCPTKVFFGRGQHKRVGEIIRNYGFKKVLLHYGGGSIKKTGLYDEVVKALNDAGIDFVELGGAQPNPVLGLVKKGIEICRKENVDLVLAVGGGSAIDSGKAIAVGAANDCDPWLFFSKKKEPERALPIGTILTLSATGSETSTSAVITNEELKLKRGLNTDLNRPLFSILNPELTFTVSPYQTACGIVDIMMHTVERYITQKGEAEVTDRIAEAVLKSTIQAGRKALKNPEDYEARATLMWAGSLSHNGLTGLGRDYFMVSHQIEHEISGMFEKVAHGAGLAVVFPAWMKYAYKYNIPRFCQYAVRVWNCEMDYENPENTAIAGIEATIDFFREIGMPTTLRELDVPEDSIEEMAVKCTNYGERILPGYIEYGKKEIIEILRLCL
ncbi:MAG: iron-containing alcohol dehydrogenase [Clostridiaceae bacterium]|nr:iron-containing alcohol dehydrogenase [Clostridiaceae bacterium]